MLFNSYPFIFCFLPIVLIIFFTLAKLLYFRAAIAFLVFASLAFYAFWDVRYVPLLIASILFNYYMGRAVEKHSKFNLPYSKQLLCLAVGINLLGLGYFKYTDFCIQTINTLLHTAIPLQHIILPLGISFFTFTQIAYLVDCYRKETHEYGLLNYSLFVTFFPHLIAGPLLYHKSIIPQFTQKQTFVVNHKNIFRGITYFSLGLAKKVLLADILGKWVAWSLKYPFELTFLKAWIAALSYTLQIYFDFSAYSDMAIGLGLMLNVQLPINFNSPYVATSIIDFWRRWHMTLSFFLKNYLYIPLGGNRFGFSKKIRNLFITMLLGGIWHGAGWTFLIWGSIHGVALIVNHTWKHFGFKLPKTLGWVLTFITVIVGWIFFRSQTVNEALLILKHMFDFTDLNLISDFYYEKNKILVLPLLIAFAMGASNLYTHPRLKKGSSLIAIFVGIIGASAILNLNNISEFLYFKF